MENQNLHRHNQANQSKIIMFRHDRIYRMKNDFKTRIIIKNDPIIKISYCSDECYSLRALQIEKKILNRCGKPRIQKNLMDYKAKRVYQDRILKHLEYAFHKQMIYQSIIKINPIIMTAKPEMEHEPEVLVIKNTKKIVKNQKSMEDWLNCFRVFTRCFNRNKAIMADLDTHYMDNQTRVIMQSTSPISLVEKSRNSLSNKIYPESVVHEIRSNDNEDNDLALENIDNVANSPPTREVNTPLSGIVNGKKFNSDGILSPISIIIPLRLIYLRDLSYCSMFTKADILASHNRLSILNFNSRPNTLDKDYTHLMRILNHITLFHNTLEYLDIPEEFIFMPSFARIFSKGFEMSTKLRFMKVKITHNFLKNEDIYYNDVFKVLSKVPNVAFDIYGTEDVVYTSIEYLTKLRNIIGISIMIIPSTTNEYYPGVENVLGLDVNMFRVFMQERLSMIFKNNREILRRFEFLIEDGKLNSKEILIFMDFMQNHIVNYTQIKHIMIQSNLFQPLFNISYTIKLLEMICKIQNLCTLSLSLFINKNTLIHNQIDHKLIDEIKSRSKLKEIQLVLVLITDSQIHEDKKANGNWSHRSTEAILDLILLNSIAKNLELLDLTILNDSINYFLHVSSISACLLLMNNLKTLRLNLPFCKDLDSLAYSLAWLINLEELDLTFFAIYPEDLMAIAQTVRSFKLTRFELNVHDVLDLELDEPDYCYFDKVLLMISSLPVKCGNPRNFGMNKQMISQYNEEIGVKPNDKKNLQMASNFCGLLQTLKILKISLESPVFSRSRKILMNNFKYLTKFKKLEEINFKFSQFIISKPMIYEFCSVLRVSSHTLKKIEFSICDSESANDCDLDPPFDDLDQEYFEIEKENYKRKNIELILRVPEVTQQTEND